MLPSFSTIADYLSCPFTVLRTAFSPPRARRLSLLLLRHAEAARGSDVPDKQRPLTAEGRADALRLGAMLKAQNVVPAVISSSPARRAVETATSVAQAAAFAGTVRTEPALYGEGVAGIAMVLRAFPRDVVRALIVGHDPAISRFLEELTGVHAALPPGGLAELAIEVGQWSQIDDAEVRARLVRLWRPGDEPAQSRDSSASNEMRKRSKWFVAAADERVIDVANRAVQEKLEDVMHRLALAADAAEQDAEAVRKLRVATRRAEAALRTFRDLLPRRATARVREHLRAVRKATNAARDDDVMLARLEALAAAEVLAVLRADRQAAQHQVRALCRRFAGDGALARSVGELQRKARRTFDAGGLSVETFGAWARARLARSAERFFTGGSPDLADIDRLHDLRLRTKKLRYEIEILSGVFPESLRAEIYPILSELQDRLGEVNDGAVVLRRLQQLRSLDIHASAADLIRRAASRGGGHALAFARRAGGLVDPRARRACEARPRDARVTPA